MPAAAQPPLHSDSLGKSFVLGFFIYRTGDHLAKLSSSVARKWGVYGSSLDWKNLSFCTKVSTECQWPTPCICSACRSVQSALVLYLTCTQSICVKWMNMGPAEMLLGLTGRELSTTQSLLIIPSSLNTLISSFPDPWLPLVSLEIVSQPFVHFPSFISLSDIGFCFSQDSIPGPLLVSVLAMLTHPLPWF